MGDLNASNQEFKDKPWWVHLAYWVKANYHDGILTLKTWKFGGPK